MAKKPWDPRFEREAEVLRRMRHTSVPGFVEAGEWLASDQNSYPYVAMELIRGFTLYDWIGQQPRTNQQVLEVLAQVARGLEEVHAKGAIHRDVKGDNIRVTEEGRAVLLDFGSCWLPEARPLTDTCAPPGTSIYRAPELLRFMWKHRLDDEARWDSSPVDDLYSLGVTAYRLVTGSYPPPVSETGDLKGEPRKLRRPCDKATVIPELEALILRLLSEDRQERGTTTEVAQALEQLAQQKLPGAQRPVLPTLAAAHTEQGLPTLPSSSSNESSSNESSSSSSSESSSSESSSSSSSERPSTEPAPRAPPSPLRSFLSSIGMAIVSGLVVVLVMDLRGTQRPAPEPPVSVTEEWHTPPMDTPDGGVSEEALLSVVQAPRPPVPSYAVSLPMPKGPLPGQKKPPCSPRSEREVMGVCWKVLKVQPPCEREGYEYGGECLSATIDAPRDPTSGEP
jgi:serine/threonine protein kinase